MAFNGIPIAPPVAAPQAGISMTGMGQLAYLLNNLPGLLTALRGGPNGQGQAMQGQAGGAPGAGGLGGGPPGGGLGNAPGGGLGAPAGVPAMGQQPPQAPPVPPAPQNLGGGLRPDMLTQGAANAPYGLGTQNPMIQALMARFGLGAQNPGMMGGLGQGQAGPAGPGQAQQMLDPRLQAMMGRFGLGA